MIAPGASIGPYQIDRELGRGGMGIVYAGHDPRLDRPVAIKSLPAELAADDAMRTRFEREAKALAGLSHPNIAAVYGLEDQDGSRYMVMELVAGRALTARLAEGRLPVDEALAACAQAAAAIEAAHERGIIHRDIKPGNIMLAPDGKVKVLDFGLARQVTPRPTGTIAPAAPTVRASPATQEGKVLGTPGYMSPEQCRGKPLDKRTDIWSLGCVLYECLTGAMAFEGETENDAVAAILEREPDWSRLPERTPLRVRELLRHCLEKDPQRRLRDAGDARLELERAIAGREWTTTGLLAAAGGSASGSRRWLAMGLSAALLVLAGVSAGRLMAHRAPANINPPQVFHVSVPIPAKPLFHHLVGIDPESHFIVYRVWTDVNAENDAPNGCLMTRRIDRDETKVIVGTQGANNAALSADGRWLAFVAAKDRARTTRTLKKMALIDGVAAGPPTILVEDVGALTDVSWASEKELVLTAETPEPTISVMSSDGGPTRLVLREESTTPKSGAWRGGTALPGGREMLMTHWWVEGPAIKEDIELVDLQTGEHRVVLPDAEFAKFVPPGLLIAVRDDSTLIAVPFDASKKVTTGDVLAIEAGSFQFGSSPFDTSASGVLAVVSRPPQAAIRRLVWVGDHGQETPVPGMARPFLWTAVSPDATRLAYTLEPAALSDLANDLWIYDMSRTTKVRLPTVGNPGGLVWSNDGKRIAYSITDGGKGVSVWERNADGTDEPVRLFSEQGVKRFFYPLAWSPDGSTLTLQCQEFEGSRDSTWILRQANGSAAWTATSYQNGGTHETSLRFSPDGQWVYFRSDKSGRQELYVQRFTGAALEDAKAGQHQVSIGGAWVAWWSKDGKEIRYLDMDDDVMSVPVETAPAFSAGAPKKLYSINEFKNSPAEFAPDGRMLVMVVGEGELITRIDLVLNFCEELKHKMGAVEAKLKTRCRAFHAVNRPTDPLYGDSGCGGPLSAPCSALGFPTSFVSATSALTARSISSAVF